MNYEKTIEYIKSLYPNKDFIALHEPVFSGNEKKYLNECIDSTFVSYVGRFVGEFEQLICNFTGAKYAVATVSGTSALHLALVLAEVGQEDEVLIQSLNFVATANAVSYCGGRPVFIDSEQETLGMCPEKLEEFLTSTAIIDDRGNCVNKITGKRIAACVPMHVFGLPSKIKEIQSICQKYNIPMIEDAAEAIGSTYDGRHMGTFGEMGIISFNGNKAVTCGGGGVIITNDENLAKKAKHLSTTAKKNHAWEFIHDEVGYNYRMPNVNAAIGCAQMEKIEFMLQNKRETAAKYKKHFEKTGVSFISESAPGRSNYWINGIILDNRENRDLFLKNANSSGVGVRPVWSRLSELKMYCSCLSTDLSNAKWLEDRIVNLPSGVRAT